ncbi:MAG: restriction endonuclease [Candidatus Wallbacteria bacterium]|nr:restriction endonuclease [Candidatus Wallbacteria bacterium]
MKIKKVKYLLKKGEFHKSEEFNSLMIEIKTAITAVSWHEADIFVINPTKMGNGVKPIKNACMSMLKDYGWKLEGRMPISSEESPGPVDAVKKVSNEKLFALEWETGNISSTHRALNKMALGLLNDKLVCGILVLPSKKFYRFLTDRVGNYDEIEPYFPIWKKLKIKSGVLGIIEIEFDGTSKNAPLIPKGTDGRALR